MSVFEGFVRGGRAGASLQADGHVEVLSRSELRRCPRWRDAFRSKRKDHRYYEVIEDTINPEFNYAYFALRDEGGVIRAVQPFFILDQDLLLGVGKSLKPLVAAIRRVLPRFMVLRTLMVGCAAGEGHLDESQESMGDSHIRLLAKDITRQAHRLKAA